MSRAHAERGVAGRLRRAHSDSRCQRRWGSVGALRFAGWDQLWLRRSRCCRSCLLFLHSLMASSKETLGWLRAAPSTSLRMPRSLGQRWSTAHTSNLCKPCAALATTKRGAAAREAKSASGTRALGRCSTPLRPRPIGSLADRTHFQAH
jgi:hypothetical protein